MASPQICHALRDRPNAMELPVSKSLSSLLDEDVRQRCGRRSKERNRVRPRHSYTMDYRMNVTEDQIVIYRITNAASNASAALHPTTLPHLCAIAVRASGERG